MIWEVDAPIDLAVTQTAMTPVIAGQNMTYTITVTNNGNSSIIPTDIFKVTDALPAGFTATSFTPSTGSYNSATGNWTGVTLASGQSITLTIVGTVSPTATGSLTNNVAVTVPSNIIDPVSANNNATLTTTVNRITDLSITKTDSPDPVVAGKTLTYTITVKNNGPSTILSSDTFKVLDSLPSGFTTTSFTPSAGSYNNVTGNWTGVTLASGSSVTLTIVGTVSSTATGNLTNIANVTPPSGVTDNNTTNDQTPPTITTVDGLPVANNDNKTTPEDTPISGNLPASDPDGPIALVNFIINGTSYTPGTRVNITGVGTIQIDSEGNYTFTPATNYNGPVPQITYKVTDGTGNNASGTLDINVIPVNDAPVAVNDTIVTSEDTPVVVPVMVNDTDVDGDSLSVTGVTNGTHGIVTLVSGVVTYTPNADYHGMDTFTYTISDGNGGFSSANVTVTVSSVNDAPVAVNDTIVTSEDTPVVVPVMVNDTDVDGDSLSVTGVTNGTHGIVTLVSGVVTYTPNANYHGMDTFTYTISDGNGGFSSANVTVTVSSVNDAPVAVNDTIVTSEDTPVVVPVMVNDTDVDGDSLSVTGVTNGTHGIVTLVSGVVTYTPNADYHGMDTFTYTISDGNGGLSSANVTVTVSAVNDAPVAVNDTLLRLRILRLLFL